jgi:hypothetical protein
VRPLVKYNANYLPPELDDKEIEILLPAKVVSKSDLKRMTTYLENKLRDYNETLKHCTGAEITFDLV